MDSIEQASDCALSYITLAYALDIRSSKCRVSTQLHPGCPWPILSTLTSLCKLEEDFQVCNGSCNCLWSL